MTAAEFNQRFMQIFMKPLTAEDIEALHDCFEHGEPVAADVVARYTGRDVKELIAAGIVRTIGRWDQQLYKGSAWPNK